MEIGKNKMAFMLSGFNTLLAAVASGGGLLMKNLLNFP